MSTVDFTLEDIARQTRQIVDDALMREREYNRAMMYRIAREVVSDALNSFWDDNLRPVLNELLTDVAQLKTDVKQLKIDVGELKLEVKRHGHLIDQHSRDVMELRASFNARP